MGIRETLNKNPSITTGATIAVILLVLGIIIWELIPHAGPNGRTNHAYFSTDDGQSYFVDDIAKIPPFDKDGKEAVRCYVFDCGGTKIVAWLEKFTDQGKAAMSNPNGGALTAGSRLVKKPGDSKWIKGSDFAKLQLIYKFNCPAGSSGPPTPVIP